MIIELEEHRLTHAVQAELTLVQGSKFWTSLPAVGQLPQVSYKLSISDLRAETSGSSLL